MPSPAAPANPRARTDNQPGPAPVTADVEVSDRELLMALTGPNTARLALIERQCGVSAGLRGDVIRLQGPAEAVQLAERVLTELMRIAREGTVLRDEEVSGIVRVLRDHPEVELAEVLRPINVNAGGGRQITPRGLAQKLYVQGIETHDIVFGVGPAG